MLNLGQDLVGAIADVLPFEGQPLDLVRKALREAIKKGKSVVNFVGAPVAVNAGYRRARREVAAARKANPNRPIIVIAYSWGTVPARQLLSYFEQTGRGANVQHVFLIDPIHLLNPRTPRQLFNLFDLDHPRVTVPEAFLDRMFVYRQSTPGEWLKGEEVRTSKGAPVPNLDVTTVPDLCANSPATCTHDGIRTADFVVNDILAKLGVACDDGLFCNGADKCDGGGGCTVHAGDPCVGGPTCADSCNETADNCLDPPSTSCDDSLFCNGSDECNGTGGCTVHAGDPCAGGPECADQCNEAADNCFDPAGASCVDDGNICTDDECNGSGACRHIVDPSNNPSCAVCGNNIREGGEECDGTDLGSYTCADLGFVGGALACSEFCTFNTYGCVAIFFEDKFDGTGINTSYWAVSTNGYPSPGVSVSSGFVWVGQPGTLSLDFPYVSSIASLFPPTGDFRLELAVQYTGTGPWGSGVDVLSPGNETVFEIWNDAHGGSLFLRGAGQVPLGGSVYTVDFADGGASLSVDGIPVLTSPSLGMRPAHVWFGHATIGQTFSVGKGAPWVDPTGTVLSRWWSDGDVDVWTTFRIDYI